LGRGATLVHAHLHTFDSTSIVFRVIFKMTR
jgi:hypothetical protein